VAIVVAFEAFGEGDEGGVGDTKVEVVVGADQLAGSCPIRFRQCFNVKAVVEDHRQQGLFGRCAELPVQQIAGLSDHQRGGHEWPGVGLQQFAAGGVVSVVAVTERNERPGVNDQHGRRRRSVSAEPVSEQLIDPMADPHPGGADPGQRQPPTPRWQLADRGGVFGKQFNGDFFDTDPARCGHRLEAGHQLGRHVQCDRHHRQPMTPTRFGLDVCAIHGCLLAAPPLAASPRVALNADPQHRWLRSR